MKKFIIAIEETVVDEFTVEAESENDALNIAKEKYHKCEFVLEPGEVQYRQMAVIKPYKDECKWVEF